MSKRNFPSFIDAFMDYTKNVGAPPKFLLWSAISGIAACLDRKTWVVYNNLSIIYPNMYIMLIADSGIARKSTSTRPIMSLLDDVPEVIQMSSQVTSASLVETIAEAGNKKSFVYNGVTYKNSSVFAYSSEAEATFGTKLADDLQILLTDLYDCGKTNQWSIRPAWDKKTLSNGKQELFNPCLNILACSTPTSLNKFIGKNGVENGFTSRIIFINQTEMQRPSGWIDEDDRQPEEETRKKLIEDLKQICSISGRYRTTVGWKDTYNAIETEVIKKIQLNDKLKSYYSRKMWHCLKLAQILAADQSNELILTPNHLVAAKELLESIEPDMYSVVESKGENKNIASFNLFWDVMRRKKSWNKMELYRLTYKHANTAQQEEHIRALAIMGKIRFMPSKDGIVWYEVVDNSPL